MISWMDDNQQASVAGCHLVNKDYQTITNVRRFPTFLNQMAVILKLPHFLPFY
jgi:hypothetical protein